MKSELKTVELLNEDNTVPSALCAGVETMDRRSLFKYLYAFTFGDGSLSVTGKNARMKITHTVDHMDFLMWKKSILSKVTSVSEYLRTEQKTLACKDTLTLTTRSHPIYKTIRDRMYLNNVKVVDPHFVKFIDWELMSIIYQDDGCLCPNTNQAGTYGWHVTLGKVALSYGDLEFLRKEIFKRLGVMFNIQKGGADGYVLRLISKNVEIFMEKVKPYMFPSFSYKLVNPHVQPRLAGEDIVRTA